ncbi:uncharacterized protein [Procambarus clarkii]|uniref:uncharacterized protein n=1 Tax=Procambarus clarkii TaxID=6728 RepID=UPI003743E17C
MVWWGVLWAWVWAGAGAGRGLCFNIETQDIVIHQGPPHSKFGFSVAQHRDTSGPWVLVGAPEANTTQPQVHQGGAVYRCHPTVPATCEPIPFDLTGNHFENGHQMDNKSQQWFGASVASQSGVIVVSVVVEASTTLVGVVVEASTTLVGVVVEASTTLVGVVVEASTTLVGVVVEASTTLVGVVVEASTTLVGVVVEASTTLVGVVVEASTTLVGVVVEASTTLVGVVVEASTTLVGVVVEASTTLVGVVVEASTTLVGVVVEASTTLVGVVVEASTTLVGVVVEASTTLVGVVVEASTTLVGVVVEASTTLVGVVVEASTTLVGVVVEASTTLVGVVVEASTTLVGVVVEASTTLVGVVVEASTTLVGVVVEASTTLVGVVVEASTTLVGVGGGGFYNPCWLGHRGAVRGKRRHQRAPSNRIITPTRQEGSTVGRSRLVVGRSLLEVGRSLLEVGRGLLEVGRGLLEVGRSLLEVGRGLLEVGRSLLEVGRSLLEVGRGLLEVGRGLLEVGRGLLEVGRSRLEVGRGLLEVGRSLLEVGRSLLEVGRGLLEVGRGLLEVGRSLLEVGRGLLEVGRSLLEVGRSRLEVGRSLLEVGRGLLEVGRSLLEVGRGLLEVGRGLLEVGRSRLEVGRGLLEVGRSLLEVGRSLLEVGRGLLEVGRSLLEVGRGLLEVGRSLLEVGRGLLEVGRRLLEVGRGLLEVGRSLLEVGRGLLEVGRRLLEVGRSLLENNRSSTRVTEDRTPTIKEARPFPLSHYPCEQVAHLFLTSRAAGEYVLGSRENLVARVRVHNSGEDAFLAKVVVKVPRGATFSRFLLTEDTSDDLTPICSSTTKAGVEEVICDLGNPLPSGAGVGLQLVFQPTPLLLNHTSLDFHLRASSANPEDPANAHDNHVALALPVTLRSDINIKGISFPDEPFDYNASQYGVGLVGEGGRVTHERQVGPEVMHVYDLTNRGPSDLPAAHIFLLWPTRTLAYDPLLYLLDPPSVSAPARCQPFHDVNYLGLQVEDASSRLQHLVGTSAGDDRPHRRPEHTDEVLNDQPVDGESSNQLHRHRRHSRHHHHPLQEERGRRSGRRSERESLQKELSCGPTNCTRVVCSIAPLRASDSIVVRVRSRLWVDTIQKVGMPEVKISSRLVVVAAPEGGDPGDWWLQGDAGDGESPEGEGSGGGVERSVWSRTVTTVVRTGPEEHRSSLKWLVVVGSILTGLLLLALLSLLLWAMGFFKRRRPQDKTETEPLNTNGFYGNGNS